MGYVSEANMWIVDILAMVVEMMICKNGPDELLPNEVSETKLFCFRAQCREKQVCL